MKLVNLTGRDFGRYKGVMASILVVEDDTDSMEMICKLLRKRKYKVNCVPNGKEALASILAKTPDLVILDLFMPEMDGAGLLEILRSYLRLQSLPVIVYTGAPDSPLLDRARYLKVNTILVKGKATHDDLVKAVEHELPRAPK